MILAGRDIGDGLQLDQEPQQGETPDFMLRAGGCHIGGLPSNQTASLETQRIKGFCGALPTQKPRWTDAGVGHPARSTSMEFVI